MRAVTLTEAQATFPALLLAVKQGETVLIVEENQAVAQLAPPPPAPPGELPVGVPIYGRGKGKLLFMADDNPEEDLKDFEEYLP